MATHVFADFSGGWAGNLDRAKIPNNMYDARNMLVYKDGSLGPRPGLRAFALGRTVADRVYACGTRIAFVSAAQAVIPQLVYIEKNLSANTSGVWSARITGAPTPLGSTGVAMNNPPLGWIDTLDNERYDNHYVSVPANYTDATMPYGGGGTYRVSSNNTITLLTDHSEVNIIYGARMVRSSTQAPRIFYSFAGSDTSWPVDNFIDIGPLPMTEGSIAYVGSQKNHLTIVMSTGDWYVLTGVLGVNDTLRKAYDDAIIPPRYSIGSFGRADTDVYALSPRNDFPIRFDGANLEQLTYVSMSPEDSKASYGTDLTTVHTSTKAFLGTTARSPCFVRVSDARMLCLHNGAWGLHQFGVSTSPVWCSDGKGLLFSFSPFISPASPQTARVTDLGLNRPAFTSDTYAQPGDLSDTPLNAWVTLAEFWSESSDPITVSEVVVDFVRYNTGVNNNGFNVKVESLGRGGSGVSGGSQTQVWTDPGSNSTTTGVADRVRVPFGNQGAGAGWRVSIEAVVGVKLRQIIVNDTEDSSNKRPF